LETGVILRAARPSEAAAETSRERVMIRQPSASRRVFSTIASVVLLVLCQGASAAQGQAVLSFPGAQGWAATTPGGRGGQIIKVTTLAASGPGSLREAVEAKGPRIVVFEVGGVIDLDRETLQITEPFITIAGQTAPSSTTTRLISPSSATSSRTTTSAALCSKAVFVGLSSTISFSIRDSGRFITT
jgi:pectate lyase